MSKIIDELLRERIMSRLREAEVPMEIRNKIPYEKLADAVLPLIQLAVSIGRQEGREEQEKSNA
jgi:GTPase Era involved in 16S rRNA processing